MGNAQWIAGRKQAQAGVTVVEGMIACAIVALVVVGVVTSAYYIGRAIPQSDSPLNDVARSVSTQARLMAAYDPTAAADITGSSWTVNSATNETGCTKSTPTCVQIATSVAGSMLTVTAQNMTTGESTSVITYLEQKAHDPTATGPDLKLYSTEAAADTACASDTVVWLEATSGVFHLKGERWYGNTAGGAYVCEQLAIANGDRVSANGQ